MMYICSMTSDMTIVDKMIKTMTYAFDTIHRYVLDVVFAYDITEGYRWYQGKAVVHCVDVSVEAVEHVDGGIC